MAAIARGIGRMAMARGFEREPDEGPARVRFHGETYRRRDAAPNTIGTLFGEIELVRSVYECLEPGERCIVPWEMQWGVVAGLATPALAERIGRWSAQHEQQAVLDLLKTEHEVSWSVASLRKVARAVRDGVVEPGRQARQERVVELLKQANASKGRHRPTLVCGRDGVMVPIRGKPTAKKSAAKPSEAVPKIEPKSSRRRQGKKTTGSDRYQEASTGTVSVHDRRGKRLGTVYYGQMPESGQKRLSQQMIAVLTHALVTIHSLGQSCPRLSYLTDAGKHQRDFFRKALRTMTDPWRPGQRLLWEWTVDFFHACTHLWQVAEALFGDTKQGWAWYRSRSNRDDIGCVIGVGA